MKFLLDQDVYALTGKFLKELDHDVVCAFEIGCSTASDSELLKIAQEQGRIFITKDRDFGELVFITKLGQGVIYLRILPSNIQAGHTELKRILMTYSENDLQNAFVVVEPGRHRFRKLL